MYSGAIFLLVLSIEFGSCYPSSAANFEVAPRFIENLCSPGRNVDLSFTHSIQAGSWAHPRPHRYGISSRVGGGIKWRGREVKLTTHTLLVPETRMDGAIRPFPHTPL
jgi:hypothetical protein